MKAFRSSIHEFEHFKLIRFENGEATTIKVFLSFVKNALKKTKSQLTMYQFWVAVRPARRWVAAVYSAQEV